MAIESFARQFPLVRIVISSREAGYIGARLSNTFSSYTLPDFTDDQVDDYVHRWFSLTAHEQDAGSARLAEQFMRDSLQAEDLRTNPLMLSLLCMLYRYEGYIPENRPRVYEQCSELLFGRWDRIRHIGAPLSTESKAHYLIQELAYFFFTHQSTQAGVDEYVLRRILQDFLTRNVVADADEARARAQDFIDYCAGRAWLLTKVGTSRQGARLFGFTHRTFMEYFVACYYVRRYPQIDALVTELRRMIDAVTSEVIPQIAIQRYDEAVADGLDDCLSMMLFDSRTLTVNVKVAYLPFVLRCLKFMKPAPHTLLKIFRAAFSAYRYLRSADILSVLADVRGDSFELLRACCKRIAAGDLDAEFDSLHVQCGCYMFLERLPVEWARPIAQELSQTLATELPSLAERYPEVLMSMMRTGRMRTSTFRKVATASSLIQFELSSVSGRTLYPGTFATMLQQAVRTGRMSRRLLSMVDYLFGAPGTLLPISPMAYDVLISCFSSAIRDFCPWDLEKLEERDIRVLRAFGLMFVLAAAEEDSDDIPALVYWLGVESNVGRRSQPTLTRALTRARWNSGGLRASEREKIRELTDDAWADYVEAWSKGEVSVTNLSK